MKPAMVDAAFVMERVAKQENGCWHWTGSVNKRLGRGTYNGEYAYRLAYRMLVGPIPEGLQINHHCDNGLCVNPDHIYAGTQAENHRDALERGLSRPVPSAKGADHHLGRPDEIVEAAIADCAAGLLSRVEIATKYGVSPATVSAWASGQWRRRGQEAIPVRDGRLRPRPACGTRAAYCAHQKRGELLDDACRLANSEYMRAYKAARSTRLRSAA